jgi:hypothetical protein
MSDPGDRVRYKVAPEPRVPLTVVAPSSVHDGYWILETDDGSVVLDRADKFEPAPDTVTITVEVPCAEAEAISRFVGDASFATDPDGPISAPEGTIAYLDTRGCRRFRQAVAEALR